LDNFKSFESLLYSNNAHPVDDIALDIFRFQAIHNPVYANYIRHLGVEIGQVNDVHQIPFLPISFFKSHQLKTGTWKEEATFTSSGTTGQTNSAHHLANVNFYLQHAERCFTHFFGPLSDYHILALLPSYLERENSSLVAMINSFIQKSQSASSGFYLHEQQKLVHDVEALKKRNDKKIMIWGVSFALLEVGEKFQPDLSNCLVFETGGMKGRRKELTRQELHSALKKYFNVDSVYSEYGMTELLSQAYSRGGDTFYPSPWMKILVREATDPFEKGLVGRFGGLNLIDLANFHSAAFIETEDVGKVFADGSFEVMGRLDNSDIRGCNLMIE
jgi:hypothetical protein